MLYSLRAMPKPMMISLPVERKHLEGDFLSALVPLTSKIFHAESGLQAVLLQAREFRAQVLDRLSWS